MDFRDITKSQIGTMHGLLRKYGLSDEKIKIVNEISNGRTESITLLTFREAYEWIRAMSNIKPAQPDPRQKMVNSIIAMGHEMGVITRKQVVSGDAIKSKNDYSLLDKWMKESSYLKKAMKDYTYEELPKLVSQYKNIYLSWLKKVR